MNNPFCYLTHKMETIHIIFGHYKLKPIDSIAFFNSNDHSADLTESIDSCTVAKTNNKSCTEIFTSVKNTSHEVVGKITAVNEPQEN